MAEQMYKVPASGKPICICISMYVLLLLRPDVPGHLALARNCLTFSDRSLKNIKLTKLIALSYLYKDFEKELLWAHSVSPYFHREPRLLWFSIVLSLSLDPLVQPLQNNHSLFSCSSGF